MSAPGQIAPGTAPAGGGRDAVAPATQKVVLVCREDLPVAVAVNAAAVLGLSVGHHLPGRSGPAVTDASGTTYPGITTLPVPVLTAPAAVVTELFRAARADERVAAVVLTEAARRAKTHEDYAEQVQRVPDADAEPVALAVYGPRNRVTRLTEHLPLMS
ncbi:DUF2000 domain-containing protein [Kineococcus indalonis]|uniref:DUF2000 domain-containing protein n=1 Tax=Kineococcus indalonis TaxID=2696566 RepID=UPI0014122117|nr:DUF2000 domain-containing protein [Kineococcus indalonis]NAZ84544.1 DUF2000 family protein [Kineococcus indalonis]